MGVVATSVDYYEEDELNWLWADTIIRAQTHGQKTLDDFCQLFHGAPSGPPQVKTYSFEDILSALNQVAPYNWRAFWTERLGNHGPGAPLAESKKAAGRWSTMTSAPNKCGPMKANRKYSERCLLDRSVAQGRWIHYRHC